MKQSPLLHALLLTAVCAASSVVARGNDAEHLLKLDISATGAGSNNEVLPLFMTTGQHGILAPTGSQGFLRAAACYTMKRNHFSFEAGLDGLGYATTHHDYYGHTLQLQQLYVKAAWKKYSITLGQKEESGKLVDPYLSSGNMLFSGNARPSADIRVGTDDFVKIYVVGNQAEGFLSVSYGRLSDGSYNSNNYNQYEAIYGPQGLHDARYPQLRHHLVENAWIHQAKAFLRSSSDYRFFVTIGLEHAAMFGGTVDNVNQDDLKGFILASLGGKGKGHGDVKATYNHLISYDGRVDWKSRRWSIAAYRQLYADDLDAGTFRGGLDGLSGLELRVKRMPWLNHIVVEYLQSTKQSGVVYANDTYWYDGNKTLHKPAGNSSFYHDEWYGGWAHYGMALGNPLLTSPIYNADHYGDFTMNMVKAFHLGCEGRLAEGLTYRFKYCHSKTWGTPFAPLNATRQNNSACLDIQYKWADWTISARGAYDHGTILGNQWGYGLTIAHYFELLNR